jgi:uncharacterized membrane protein YwzB
MDVIKKGCYVSIVGNIMFISMTQRGAVHIVIRVKSIAIEYRIRVKPLVVRTYYDKLLDERQCRSATF